MLFRRVGRPYKAAGATRLFEQLESRELFSVAPVDVMPLFDGIAGLLHADLKQHDHVAGPVGQAHAWSDSVSESSMITDDAEFPLAMVVTAGPEVTVERGAWLQLSGEILGRWNSAELPTQWSQVSGPGTSEFSNPSDANSLVRFDRAGSYGLQLWAGNEGITVLADLSVDVTDEIPPMVTAISPADGSTNIATNATVTVTFSEAVNASTVNTGTLFLLRNGTTAVAASVSYDAASQTATLTPSTALANSTAYTIVVQGGAGGVKDDAGNALAADATASFSTVAQVDPALVAAYAFNEGTGTTIADASGNGNTGTLHGATWTDAGQYGQALSFNGTDAYVDLGNSDSLQLTESMTISAWINSTAYPYDDAAIVSKGLGAGGFQLDTTIDTGPRTIGFKLTNASGAYMIRYGSTTLAPNQWYHVTGVYNAGTRTMDVYLNGVLDNGQLVGTVTSTQQTSALNVVLGKRSGANGYEFNGRIDEVRIYDRAISLTEIQSDMNTTVGTVAPDTTPPVITGVASSGITSSAATIAWTTNEVADTQVEYGTTTSYGSSTPLNAALVTSHSVNLGGLTTSTVYHYRVMSRDAAGNLTTSADFTFTTTTPDTTPPVISSVATSGITGSGATIAWITNEVADTQVEYGTTTSYGSSTTLNPSLVTDHTVSLNSLSESTLYHFRVKSRDASGNLTTSADFTFTTQASTVTVPELPRVYLDTTYAPPVGGQVRTVNAGDNLQSVLNVAQPGDIIVLQAGATFTGNFTMPAKAGGGSIYIQSSAYASLPGPGTRVGPGDVSVMARILSPNEQPALLIDKNVHNVRVVGIELSTTYAVQTGTDYGVVGLGYSASTAAEFPDNIIFDRVYIHGTSTGNIYNGINGSAVGRFGLIDSYISDVHVVGGESHGIQIFRSTGPTKIDNNYIAAAGINVFFGDNPNISDQFLPSDIQVTRNHLFKPLSWKVGDPSYAGIHWLVKNLLELKGAHRVLMEGNLLENNWADSQNGSAVLFTPRGGTVSDVTFRSNVLRGSEIAFNIVPADKAMWNVLLENNLLYNINYRLLNAAAAAGGPITNFIIRHNTWTGAVNNCLMFFEQGNPAIIGFVVYDNIFEFGAYGVLGNGTSGGLSTISNYATDYDWNNNVLIGASEQYQTDSMFRGFLYAANNGEVGFQGASLSSIADFRLSASSPYKGRATDGTDIGANIDAILAAMQAG